MDPLPDVPIDPSGFLSYGNCLVTKPYAENCRKMDYMDLGLQKQDKLMLKTNGSHTARDSYAQPTAIAWWG